MALSANQLNKVNDLIELMKNQPVLSDEEQRLLCKAALSNTVTRMVNEGVNYGLASGAPAFYNQSEGSFAGFMKSVDHDIEWQCETVSNAFKRYCAIGEIPPPYFTLRVAVLLRKAKETELEKRFLAAWCKHFFFSYGSGKYATIVSRAKMVGAIYH